MPRTLRRYEVAVRSLAVPETERFRQRRDAIRRARALADRNRGFVVDVIEVAHGRRWLVYRAEWIRWPFGYAGYGHDRGDVVGRETIEPADGTAP